MPSGMYLPNLPFNQQQQMQVLFWDDLVKNAKQFGRDVGNTGNQIVGHINNALPTIQNGWENIHSDSYNQYGVPVFDGVSQGLDHSSNIFDMLAKMKQQQQMQVMLI